MGAAKQKTSEDIENVTSDLSTVSDENEGNIEVSVDDDDEPEIDIPGEVPTRDEKKRNRWAEHKAKTEAAEAKAVELERQLAEERGRTQAFQDAQRQMPQQQQADPFVAQEQMVLKEIENLRKDFANMDSTKLSQEDVERFHGRWRDLDTAHKTIITRREIRNAQAQQQPPNTVAQAAEVHVRMNYPELADNAVALQYTNGLLIQAQAQRQRQTGRAEPPTMQMLDEALKETRRALSLGPKAPPSQAVKARFSGMPATQSGASSNGRKTVQMGKDERAMARARWPKLEPEKAYRLFAKEQADRNDDS